MNHGSQDTAVTSNPGITLDECMFVPDRLVHQSPYLLQDTSLTLTIRAKRRRHNLFGYLRRGVQGVALVSSSVLVGNLWILFIFILIFRVFLSYMIFPFLFFGMNTIDLKYSVYLLHPIFLLLIKYCTKNKFRVTTEYNLFLDIPSPSI